MEVNSRDTEVINLLTKLKNANGTYPQELLAMRRQGYLKQVAEVSAGAGLALALKSTIKNGKGIGGGAPAASALLETLLVVAIVAEASTVAYFYSGKLAELYRSFSNSPRVTEVSGSAVIESPIPTFELTPSPMVTVSATETETPTGTPSLELAAETTTTGGDGEEGSQSQTLATPNPSDRTNDNNGNQYGLTPKPERTKDPATNDVKDSDTNDNKSGPNKNK